ncbi:MAG: hypothetical protein COV00_00115 [Candidatus Tagabacteria bacterium CG10_big_fil_rev_8_21_14_0_10_40_13]|nr:MAG: hypothetical protein COV00_00115 [Candidatus Tagabacteria bacterium CG10_big_fil_rev_8_21_14_0_10_40_13]
MIFSLAVFVIVATAILFYSQGYSINRNLTLSRHGGLYISTPFSGSEIFINNENEKKTGVLNGGLFKSNLKPGYYAALVAKDGFWPWAKTLEVKEGMVAEARAIMVPENLKGEIIEKGNFSNLWSHNKSETIALKEKNGNFYSLSFYLPDKDIYLTADSNFTKQLLTFKDDITALAWDKNYLIFKSEKGLIKASFNFSSNTASAQYSSESFENYSTVKYERLTDRDREKLWWNPPTNQVFVDWLEENGAPPYYICDENCDSLPLQIFQSKFTIQNIEFFPQRKDVIIIAVGNGVYALEIDGRGGRLIYPIYKGKKPTFGLSNSTNYIYILDDSSLLKMYLK